MMVVALAFDISDCGGSSHGDGPTAEDKAYAQDVTQHHSETVQLVNLPSIHTLPSTAWAWTEPVRTQHLSELTSMIRLLRGWHAKVPDTGLHHVDEGTTPHFDTSIPGMIPSDQTDALEDPRGGRLRHAWLRIFIAHERGAVQLAQREVDSGHAAAVVRIAKQDVRRHRTLLTKLRRLLANVQPLPPR